MSIGKFQACNNPELGEYLYNLSLDGSDNELGDVSDFGWYCLLLNVPSIGKMKSYILNEDNDGFITYTEYNSNESALKAWSQLESEYTEFENNIE